MSAWASIRERAYSTAQELPTVAGAHLMIVVVEDGPRRRVWGAERAIRHEFRVRVAGALGRRCSPSARCGDRDGRRPLHGRSQPILPRPAVQARRVPSLPVPEALSSRENGRVRVGLLCMQKRAHVHAPPGHGRSRPAASRGSSPRSSARRPAVPRTPERTRARTAWIRVASRLDNEHREGATDPAV